MNETKKLLQLALEVMDCNSVLAAIVTRKALKQLDEHNDKKWEEWMNEKPERCYDRNASQP